MLSVSSMDNDCNVLTRNSTESIPGWEGIPESIVFNALLATVMLIILSVVRIIYFKRKPYENDWNINWLQFIYSDRSVEVLHSENHINRLHTNAYLPPCLQLYAELNTNRLQDDSPISSLYVTNNLDEKMKMKHQAKLDNVGKYRYWLLDYILIKDKDIYEHRGNDAFQYLLFQRYIIYFLTALTAVCMIILVPINIYGKNGGKHYFEMTTINNIKETSDIFWIHTIISIAVVILGLLMMKNFSDLIFTPPLESDDRTILIQNIPESKRNARLLKNFVEKKFIGVEVSQVTFTYDVEELRNLKIQQEVIESALDYCEKYEQEYGYPLQISPYFLGRFSLLCPQVDAVSYYQRQQREYQLLVREEIWRVISDPKHAVFIQFQNSLMAQRILEHFDNTHHERVLKRLYKYLKKCFTSQTQNTDADTYGYNMWTTKAAPVPDDIEWKDIVMNTNTSGIWAILLNLVVFIIFFFLTTPLVAVNFLDSFVNKIGMNTSMPINEIQIGSTKIQLAKYFSILLLGGVASILPNLIMLIQLKVPRSTRSEKNHQVMKYVYLFLIFMVVIFPSINLNSGQMLINKLLQDGEKYPKNVYKCLFPAASSAWFVQVVISYAFVNNSFELLRLSELAQYLIYCLIYPRTEAEMSKARMETSFVFNFCSSYPRFLLVFTIVTTYSIACPIIAPFGLLYMLIKHLVDRYSIYYLYSTPVISANIHQTAITFVLISFFFMLLQLTAFLNTRIQFSLEFKPSNVCTVAFILYIILLCFTCSSFDYLYPKEHSTNRYRDTKKKTVKECKSKSDHLARFRCT